jgi:hypothetical protein
MQQVVGAAPFRSVGCRFWRLPPRLHAHGPRLLSIVSTLLPCFLGAPSYQANASDCSAIRAGVWIAYDRFLPSASALVHAPVLRPACLEAEMDLIAKAAVLADEDAVISPLSLLQVVQIRDSDFQVGDVTGWSGQPIPVRILIPSNADLSNRGNTFLLLRGYPEGFEFSAGLRMSSGWIVSWRDISALSMLAKPGYEGSFLLEVLFYRGPDLPPIKRVVNAEVRLSEARPGPDTAERSEPVPQPRRAPTAVANTATITKEAPRIPPVLNLSSQEENAMLTQGKAFVSSGNIASARFLFEDLAAKGSGLGAFALGQTFDPNFLQTIVVVGARQSNPEEAKKWYRKAAERGHREAQERLRALESRQP